MIEKLRRIIIRLTKKDSQLKSIRVKHWQLVALFLMLYDVIAVNLAYFMGLWIRYDFVFSAIPMEYITAFGKFVPVYSLFALVVFSYLRLYKSIWKFASFNELIRISIACLVTSVFHVVAITFMFKRMPVSYYVIGTLVQAIAIVMVRFSYRFILLQRSLKTKSASEATRENIMIIGAGAAGQIIIRELKNSQRINGEPACIIDDNPNKWDRFIEGVPIVGGRDDILMNVEKYMITQILVAMPSAAIDDVREILNICKETGCQLKRLPGVYQIANGDVSLAKMKPVAVEDLLGREPIKVDLDKITGYLKNQTVLVTGGGGSIGSELSRQIAKQNPKQLIIFDIYENNAYAIEQELRRNYKDLNLLVLIGSVRDSRRINWVFETYKPDIVYHAAAHKHVPLMETSPGESIKNNVIGTYKTARAALLNNCKRFVLISTDKAVNPTNIMGASKRLCEMVVQSMDVICKKQQQHLLPRLSSSRIMDEMVEKNNTIKTEFVAVRFGNVLGSNGSVIPLFKKQIEEGGPVTVTHPDIIRYFMTIPEAVSLVLQAGSYAKGGEIFVLDMGDPVKIDTLARNLIKLSGYKPGQDIDVVYTGLRPGEKLYEEKLMAEEGMLKTDNELIHIGKPIKLDVNKFLTDLEDLANHCYSESDDVIELVKAMVPTFQPPELDKDKYQLQFEKLYNSKDPKSVEQLIN